MWGLTSTLLGWAVPCCYGVTGWLPGGRQAGMAGSLFTRNGVRIVVW